MARRLSALLRLSAVAALVLLGVGCANEVVEGRGTVTGIVTEAATGLPIAGAEVRGGALVNRTGLDGRFVLDGLPAGKVGCEVAAPGYRRAVVPGLHVLGQMTGDVSVALESHGSTVRIEGTVFAAASSGLSGVTVAAGSARTTSGRDGSYAIDAPMSEARAVLVVAAPDGETATDEVAVSGPAQTELRHDIRLSGASQSGSVAGTVIDAHDGTPIPGACVSIGAGGPRCATDERGRYRVDGIAEGPTEVSVAVAGYRGERRSARVAAGSVTTLDVPLVAPSTGEIHARATNPTSGEPIAGVTVTTSPLGRSATTGRDGTARLSHVPVGEYSLRLYKVDHGDATIGLVRVTEVEWPEVRVGLDVTRGGLIGALADPAGRPLAGSPILLAPATRSGVTPPPLPQATATASDGRFAVHDVQLPPEGVTVRLIPEGGSSVAHARLLPGRTTDAGPLTRTTGTGPAGAPRPQ